MKEGIIPGIGMWRAARYAGLGRAKRPALSADVVDTATALDWGLVDWVAGAEEFESRVAQLAARIESMAWTSTRLTKKLTNMHKSHARRRYADARLKPSRYARISDTEGNVLGLFESQ